ncbi:MAG TPA: hypothetical protein VK178_18710 [Opitutaceae bacterium]|nr:hypothetical protein [Opitutaceae bacterium]
MNFEAGTQADPVPARPRPTWREPWLNYILPVQRLRYAFAWLLALTLVAALPAQEVLERLGERLNFRVAGGALSVRLSGSLELEGYAVSEPVADLVSGDEERFFNPRFTLYLDAQAGARGYLFAQVRLDRGFDAYTEGGGAEIRFDEYALRLELSQPGTGRLFMQAGKFATVVGNWTKRHTAWENPFITAPLPYDNLTAVWDAAPAPDVDVLLAWAHVQPVGNAAAVLSDKHLRLPIVWGPAYGQGVALAGRWGRLDYAGEIKATNLSARPERWNQGFGGVERPTVSARVGWRPSPAWNLGFSCSRGEYLDRSPHSRFPAGIDRHDYRQTVIAHDLSYAWRKSQLWAEIYAARFAMPGVADLDTVAGYIEAKYRFTPRFSAAVRWNQQFFGRVTNSAGESVRWGRQTWRLDVAPTWRFTTQTQIKLQYSLRHEAPARASLTEQFAVQLNVRF